MGDIVAYINWQKQKYKHFPQENCFKINVEGFHNLSKRTLKSAA